MHALTIQSKQVKFSEDVAEPNEPEEVLVQVELAGVCDTDLQLQAGYMDFSGVPGHEFVGKVLEGPEALVGQRVVGEINVACHVCPICLNVSPRHCPHRTVLGILGRSGAHAQLLSLPARNLIPVPKQVPNEHAVFAEPLAAACEILEQVKIDPNMKVVVVGDGKLGLLIAQVLALTGCDLRVIGRHQHKLNILSQRGIATEAVVRGESSSLPDMFADVVVECTGHESGYRTARRLLRPRGTLVLKTTIKTPGVIDPTDLVVNEITLLGSRCGQFAPAMRLMAQGLIDLDSMIVESFALHQGVAAYQRARERGILKVLLEP